MFMLFLLSALVGAGVWLMMTLDAESKDCQEKWMTLYLFVCFVINCLEKMY